VTVLVVGEANENQRYNIDCIVLIDTKYWFTWGISDMNLPAKVQVYSTLKLRQCSVNPKFVTHGRISTTTPSLLLIFMCAKWISCACWQLIRLNLQL